MIKSLAVFNSNTVNLYGSMFTVSALESGLGQTWEFGLPLLLSHNYHRPVAWTAGLAVYLEPGLARLAGLQYAPETAEDSEQLTEWVQRYLGEKLYDRVEPHRAELEHRVGHHNATDELPATLDCAALVSVGLATRVFPEVFGERDRDGLVPIRSLKQKAPGVFERDGLLLFAHPYFRRSLSRLNSLNTPFLERLHRLAERQDLSLRIALDEDMVGLANTYREHFEFEYWWGPKFTEDLTKIPIGVSRHEATDRQRTFHGISRAEFWWYRQDGRQTLECEELTDIESMGVGKGQYGCRFVHSMLDPQLGLPTHLDGAIRMYVDDAMVARLDTDISKAGKHTDYTKLWRVDGPLDVATWKELITHYYRDNHLVGEYFGADESSQNDQVIAQRGEEPSLYTYVPCHLEQGQGIRLSVSYQPQNPEQPEGRSIRTFTSVTADSGEHWYVESNTIEVVKLLRRAGQAVEIPADIVPVNFGDMVDNFAPVLHAGPDAQELAEKTRQAFRQLFEAWAGSGVDRLVAYTIGLQYAGRDLYVSVAGPVQDVVRWLQDDRSRLPLSLDNAGDWCEQTYEFISQCQSAERDVPSIGEMLKPSGILQFERRFIDRKDLNVEFDDNPAAAQVRVEFRPERADELQRVRLHRLRVAPVYLVRSSHCSACGAPYWTCEHSKVLDSGITQRISSCKLMGFTWTNRRA